MNAYNFVIKFNNHCYWEFRSSEMLLLCGALSSFFVLLQKSYETKQYKKGLKAADAILKKFPDHGGMLFWYLLLHAFTSCMFGVSRSYMKSR